MCRAGKKSRRRLAQQNLFEEKKGWLLVEWIANGNGANPHILKVKRILEGKWIPQFNPPTIRSCPCHQALTLICLYEWSRVRFAPADFH